MQTAAEQLANLSESALRVHSFYLVIYGFFGNYNKGTEEYISLKSDLEKLVSEIRTAPNNDTIYNAVNTLATNHESPGSRQLYQVAGRDEFLYALLKGFSIHSEPVRKKVKKFYEEKLGKKLEPWEDILMQAYRGKVDIDKAIADAKRRKSRSLLEPKTNGAAADTNVDLRNSTYGTPTSKNLLQHLATSSVPYVEIVPIEDDTEIKTK